MKRGNFDDNDDDDFPEEDNTEDFSGILNKLKLYLLDYYEPVRDPKDAEFHYSTAEIWRQLLKLFPNELILTQDLVAQWMHIGGFTWYDYGEIRLEWMMKRKSL